PILFKPTPEGARDFIVPSRLQPGRFFALPQSPQILKQLLVIAGFERYFQIARCFRDEDLRADRVQELTQLDVEMAFPDVEFILALMEAMMSAVWRECVGVELETPFPRLSYADSMLRYGTDKPDLRFEPELEAIRAEPSTTVLFGADEPDVVARVLGALRQHLGEQLGLVDQEQWRFVWVTDFPMFDWSEDEQRWTAVHHPFTRPTPESE